MDPKTTQECKKAKQVEDFADVTKPIVHEAYCC